MILQEATSSCSGGVFQFMPAAAASPGSNPFQSKPTSLAAIQLVDG